MEPLSIQHSLSLKLKSDCEKIINDPKLIKQKAQKYQKLLIEYIQEWVTN